MKRKLLREWFRKLERFREPVELKLELELGLGLGLKPEELEKLKLKLEPEELEEVKQAWGMMGRLLDRERVKDSWARRLRRDEAKRIRRISVRLLVTAIVTILIGSFIVFFSSISVEFLSSLTIGTSTALFFWFLVSYGDHELRKIRVQNGWYGNNAMEVHELLLFIKKTAKDDSDDGNPSRRFFEDDELTADAIENDKVFIPDNGVEVH